MAIAEQEIADVLEQLIVGTARLQARHDMLECFVRALITEAQPSHFVMWRVLEAARADWDRRQIAEKSGPWPALDAAALGLWNELRDACAPPARSFG